MGAWGPGPFDNDTALDLLGDLCDSSGARYDDDYRLIEGSVQLEVFVAEVRQVLLRNLSPVKASYSEYFPGEPFYHCDKHVQVYTAAALVAASLQPALQVAQSTSLVARMSGDHEVDFEDAIGLGAGMQYAQLLQNEHGQDLRTLALLAMHRLQIDESWHRAFEGWGFDAQTMAMNLAGLAQALEV